MGCAGRQASFGFTIHLLPTTEIGDRAEREIGENPPAAPQRRLNHYILSFGLDPTIPMGLGAMSRR
ncbi:MULTISPECIES: hypothetical protein [unclassified Synechococcus]|uniref:hypothetical protein n=1 Tax=unclassified Synechococcus TaxID=2626047 RepID=UPI00006948B2|nr:MULTISPECIES: hypothetical protein [unclassified Synechococcus]ABD00815.1 hypothetical protein CYA_2707 [Synechococcus sp. JA-3-3Ab]